MNSVAHIEALKEKHEALDAAIHQETLRPQPDEDTIHTLKKQKLLLKDEISRAVRS